MKIETRPVRRVLRQMPRARAHRKDPANDLERLPQRRDVGVRSEIARAGDRHPPHHQDTRKRLSQRHRDLRVALIVAEPDVELGLMLFDERVLEQQRLGFGRDDDGVDVVDLPLQDLALDAALLRREILRHARPQVGRLSHIHDLPGGVFPEVDAGVSGQCRYFAGEPIRDCHARIASGWRKANVSAPYATPKIPSTAMPRSTGRTVGTTRSAAMLSRAATNAASTTRPSVRQSVRWRIAPIRLSRSYRCSAVLKVHAIDEPNAIPAGPSRRMKNHDNSVDITSETTAMRTGVRVSRIA